MNDRDRIRLPAWHTPRADRARRRAAVLVRADAGGARDAGSTPDTFSTLATHAGLPAVVGAIEPVRAATAAAAVAAVVTAPLLGPPGTAFAVATLILAAAARVGPVLGRPALVARARRRRDAALPDALERLGAELRAGASLRQALGAVSADTPGLLGEELAELHAGIDAGAGVADAVDGWRRRAASADVTLAATALVLAASAGGPAARSIDAVAASLRAQAEVRAEARSLATQARASATVLGLAPVGFTVVVAVADPHAAVFLVRPGIGLACSVAGLALLVAGLWWMQRIVADVA